MEKMSENIFYDDVFVTLIDCKLGYVLLCGRKVAFGDLTDSLFFSVAAIYLTAPDCLHSIVIISLIDVFYDLNRSGRITTATIV